MRKQKVPCAGNFFSAAMSRIAAFYAGLQRVVSEWGEKHAIHPVVHLRVHLSESHNSHENTNLNARRCESWARVKHQIGLERPHFFYPFAPKKVLGVVPAHICARRVSTMEMFAISIP